MEIAELRTTFSPPSPRNTTKAMVLMGLDLYSQLGKPWATSGDLWLSLGLQRSVLTLLARWQAWGYIDRAGIPGSYSYRIAKKGRAWLESLPQWWPEIKRGIPVEADLRLAAIDSCRLHVAESIAITVWTGHAYGRGYVADVHTIRAPFFEAGDYSYIGKRVPLSDLGLLLESDYLVEAKDALQAVNIVCDKLGLPVGRPMLDKMVEVGLLTWG